MKKKYELPVTLLESVSLYTALVSYRDSARKEAAEAKDSASRLRAKAEVDAAKSLLKKVRSGHLSAGWDIPFLG